MRKLIVSLAASAVITAGAVAGAGIFAGARGTGDVTSTSPPTRKRSPES